MSMDEHWPAQCSWSSPVIPSLIANLVCNKVVGAARVGSVIWQFDSYDTLGDM